MKRTPIKSSIPTLRPGDVITNLACRSCSGNLILVLERNADGMFELSESAGSITICRDTSGPFRWNGELNTFLDKKGKPYDDHINRDSVVLEGAGMTELGWYVDLPKAADASFMVDPRDLPGFKVDKAVLAKLTALATMAPKTAREEVQYMQLGIELALGVKLNEQQMRQMLIMLNIHAGKHAAEAAKTNGVGGLLSAIMAGMFSDQDGGMEAMFGDMSGFGFDVRRAGESPRGGRNGQGRDERRPAHAG
jgi:hypothetical protein